MTFSLLSKEGLRPSGVRKPDLKRIRIRKGVCPRLLRQQKELSMLIVKLISYHTLEVGPIHHHLVQPYQD
jgi:hypothetical protein